MKNACKTAVIGLLVAILAGAALGDKLTLKDGRIVEGEIVRETESSITVRMKLGEATFDKDNIKSIEYGPVDHAEKTEEDSEAKPNPRLKSEREAISLIRRYVEEENAETRAKLAESLQKTFETDPEMVERAAGQFRKHSTRRTGHIKGMLEVNGEKTDYALYVPEKYELKKPLPLIVALHGRSGNGPAYVRLWHVPVKGKLPHDQVVKYQQAEVRGYIVVAPTANREWGWGPSKEADEHILRLIEHVRDRYNVDADRIYIHGLSMGGYGAWRFGLHYADRFAAAEPRAGGYDLRFIENAKNLPIYISHGAKDESVPVKVSRDAAAKLKELDYDYHYSEITEGGHQFFIDENQKVLDFFDKKKRDAYPKEIVWIADKQQHGRAYWLKIDEFKSPGFARLEASYDKVSNTVNVKAENVGKLAVFVSGKMVNFAEPVVVRINGVEKHNALVVPSAATLLDELRESGDESRLFMAKLQFEIE